MKGWFEACGALTGRTRANIPKPMTKAVVTKVDTNFEGITRNSSYEKLEPYLSI